MPQDTEYLTPQCLLINCPFATKSGDYSCGIIPKLRQSPKSSHPSDRVIGEAYRLVRVQYQGQIPNQCPHPNLNPPAK